MAEKNSAQTNKQTDTTNENNGHSAVNHMNQKTYTPVAPSDIWKVMSVIDKVEVVARTVLKIQVVLVDGKSS